MTKKCLMYLERMISVAEFKPTILTLLVKYVSELVYDENENMLMLSEHKILDLLSNGFDLNHQQAQVSVALEQ